METESPGGLNLHPAKQPRTTLFDWLPAGLPSVPTWTNLHESLRVPLSLPFPLSLSYSLSLFLSFSSTRSRLICFFLFFFYFVSLSLSLSCHFVSSKLSPLPPPTPSTAVSLLALRRNRVRRWSCRNALRSTDRVRAARPFLGRLFLHSDSKDREENGQIPISLIPSGRLAAGWLAGLTGVAKLLRPPLCAGTTLTDRRGNSDFRKLSLGLYAYDRHVHFVLFKTEADGRGVNETDMPESIF